MWGIVFSRKAFYGMVRISDLFFLLGRVEGFFTSAWTTSFFPRQEQHLQSFSSSVDMGAGVGRSGSLGLNSTLTCLKVHAGCKTSRQALRPLRRLKGSRSVQT